MNRSRLPSRLTAALGAASLVACSSTSPAGIPVADTQSLAAKVDIVDEPLPAPGAPWFGDAPGSTCADRAHASVASLAVSQQGEIVIGGRFDGRPDFGDGPIEAIPGGQTFVAAFTASGHLRWSHAFTADDISVIYDGEGNIDVLRGMYAVVNVPGGSAAVDQFGPDGALRWTRETDPAPNEDHMGIAMAAAADGSVVVAVPGRLVRIDAEGTLLSAADYADVSANSLGFAPSGAVTVSGISNVLSSPERRLGFLAHIASGGADAWRIPIIGPDAAGSDDAVFSATGNGTVVSGYFADQVTLGATTVVAPEVDGEPQATGNYLALVSDDGTVAWARDISDFGVGGPASGFDDPARSIAFDDAGDIILGFSDGSVSLGAFDRTGHRTWTRRFSGLDVSSTLAAPVPGSTDLVVAGSGHIYGCADSCDPCDDHARPFLFRITRSGDLASGFEGHL